MEKPKRVETTCRLPVKMTKDQQVAIANQLAEIVAKIEQDKQNMTMFRDSIKEKQGSMDNLLAILRRGSVEREVECEYLFDFKRKVKTLVRMDTGENLGDYTLTKEELQVDMEDVDGEAEAAKAGIPDVVSASGGEIEHEELEDEPPPPVVDGPKLCPDCSEMMVYDGTLYLCPACGQTVEDEG